MTTKFNSIDEAKGFAAYQLGIELGEMILTPDLHAGGIEMTLLDDSDTSDEMKKAIQKRYDAQVGFTVLKKVKSTKCNEFEIKTIKVVIGPFRDGYDCYLLSENGMGFRI